MGCNCKKQYDKMKRYADDGTEVVQSISLLSKLSNFVLQFLFGILIVALFIVMVIPLLLYVIVCVLFGLSPSIRILDLRKRLKINGN